MQIHRTPLLRLLVLLPVLLASPTPPCASDLDCSLNGACGAATCTCRRGWKGSSCGVLDLRPSPAGVEAFHRPTTASWGGGVVFAEGAWHLFVAVMERHCGLDTWGSNSAVYKAVSSTSSPAGPYVNESRVLSHWAHSPRVTQTPDGTYVVWHVGCGGGDNSSLTNCTNGTTPGTGPPPVHVRQGGGDGGGDGGDGGGDGEGDGQTPANTPSCKAINALTSHSIEGPWTERSIVDATALPYLRSALDDPAPLVFPNGTTWIIGRSWNDPWPKGGGRTPMGVARSVSTSAGDGDGDSAGDSDGDSTLRTTTNEPTTTGSTNPWEMTYVVDPVTIPQYRNTSAFAAHHAPEYIAGEDDFVWIDETSGTFHLLFHSMEGTCSQEYGDNEAGCHAFSEDGYDWILGNEPAYNSTIHYSDGKHKSVARRERPLLVFDRDGGFPTHLMTANQDSWLSDHTYTHIQPLGGD